MRTWTPPEIPEVEGNAPTLKLFNTATNKQQFVSVEEGVATLYVCGITPYDATHIGHAFTYLAFDLMQRAWLDGGVRTEYAQNITDVDDPLLERANATGVDWRDLAANQIALYRSDMHRLGMIPPEHFVAVTERIDEIAEAVHKLHQLGFAYKVPSPDGAADIYFDTQKASGSSEWQLGDISQYDRDLMLLLSKERGGDPERAGKRDPLDPLLWRGKREGEPSWETVVGEGRPGWHIECSEIAVSALGSAFTVQGGGEDLRFPHHEFSAAHATALTNMPMAHHYCHVALVSYQGHKMSKSRGNLVFVSELLDSGVAPGVLRLALLAHHYRTEWEWFDADLDLAKRRIAAWQTGFSRQSDDPLSAKTVVNQLRQEIANDLNTPVMLATLDAAWDRGVDDPQLLADATEALLGVTVRPLEAGQNR
ncbi:cysteine--1-D-myo-inosityl 2-amino-2-deoxy-alpha-D-glucopyranoside ligase [Leucobacter chinensis]|uniref:cysteine--1-D-myo-inosityl 2-amino-2-deoxy-alpha-D-glucopyranoside ligase n=1 Tax=Leucobacter chinensis TaxID=2851010 RepID=UPI001C2329B2|nr:cysteine--1-D-myo-inosityl 2-amino-2-deoxy-alpha-D-glucopyranoside ligase [Leucobacter chinensis]